MHHCFRGVNKAGLVNVSILLKDGLSEGNINQQKALTYDNENTDGVCHYSSLAEHNTLYYAKVLMQEAVGITWYVKGGQDETT